MARDPGRNLGAQFGISEREESEMAGRALGGHIWDGFAEIFGGEDAMRRDFQSSLYDKLSEGGWDPEAIHINTEDESNPGSPYGRVDHPSGYHARTYGGQAYNVYGPDGNEVDIRNKGGSRKDPGWTADEIYEDLDEWHNNGGYF